jgi:GMP synthase (glutamine-hydrolysing)
MASHFEGKVGTSTHREYGHANVQVMRLGHPFELADQLLQGLDDGFQV